MWRNIHVLRKITGYGRKAMHASVSYRPASSELSYPEAPQLTLRSMGMIAATINHLRSGDQFRGSSGSS